MIVDDQAVIRSILREIFEPENFDVSDATDGAEGVRKAQAEKPNLINSRSLNAIDEWTRQHVN